MSEEVAQYIEECLESLRTDGWCVGRLVDDAGARCAYGALYDTPMKLTLPTYNLLGPRAIGKSEMIGRAVDALYTAIPLGEMRDIVLYNNSRTDFAEVEVWFKQAAANERESA